MNRSQFLKIGTISAFAAYLPINAWADSITDTSSVDRELYAKLLTANDQEVSVILSQSSKPVEPRLPQARIISTNLAVLMASYTTQGSKYYQAEDALRQMKAFISDLLKLQHPNGTIDAGGNKQSPPDTAFLLEYLCPAAKLLQENRSVETDQLATQLDEFLLKAGEALLTGGVHTPNHRWVISAALANLYVLYKDERYLNRIDEWMADGVYQDADGQYPERSRIYSKVENTSFITIAHLLKRPELLEVVRNNLDLTYYLLEENGELVTVDSRRQDQNKMITGTIFFLNYRYLAIYYQDDFFSSITRKIEQFDDFDEVVLSKSFIHFLDNPMLLQKLPKSKELPANYLKYLPFTQLARIKRGQVTATISGANDFPVTIASGRSNNPTFLTFRKGEAILEYARLSTSFFNTGYFRSEGLQYDQNTYRLHERKEAYYYQPLLKEKRNLKGDYELTESPDGRFWSKMDFKNRPISDVQTMETDVTLTENNGELEMNIKVTGVEGVDVTLELCFRSGGYLSDVLKSDNEGDFFLNDGYASYQFGSDTIQIGPGIMEHQNIDRIDGEQYSTHFGSIKGKGMHLFLTGRTPFTHTISLK